MLRLYEDLGLNTNGIGVNCIQKAKSTYTLVSGGFFNYLSGTGQN